MKTLKVTAEFEEKLQRWIHDRTSASLMSNAKWRKLFRLISKHSVSFAVAWIQDPEHAFTRLEPPVPESRILANGIADPGIGGPCLFKEILSLRIPAYREIGGHRVAQSLDALQSDLNSIGQFPLVRTPDCIEIKGYRRKNGGEDQSTLPS